MRSADTLVDTWEAGFAILPGLLPANDLAAVEEFLDSAQPVRAGRRHLLRYDVVRRLANDPRLLAVAATFIGAGAAPFKATLFDKSPTSNWLVAWHQDVALPVSARVDAPGWGPWNVKEGQLYGHAPADILEQIIALRVHLDDSTAHNGPLRVLPQTHLMGRLSESRMRELARERRPLECTVTAGGIIAMRPLLVHASSKSVSAAPRRVLHFEYARRLPLPPGVALGATAPLGDAQLAGRRKSPADR